MQSQDIIRVFLFVVFFSIGAAALGCSVLCDDLLRYYRNRELLESEKNLSNKLESLNADYDELLEGLRKNPNRIKQIAPATLGMEPNDANTVYPKATAEQLAAARKALAEISNRNSTEPKVPAWLTRCSEPYRRIMLFFASAALILIAFTCFGPAGQKSKGEIP